MPFRASVVLRFAGETIFFIPRLDIYQFTEHNSENNIFFIAGHIMLSSNCLYLGL